MFKKLINKKNTINNYNEELDSSNIPNISLLLWMVMGDGLRSEKCLELKANALNEYDKMIMIV
ncbi:hypothetical protein U5U_01726 [Staphylococcus aureus M1119]|nr:hypothetical protein U5U_01726 [Staphylococcus aureus M1119]